MRRGVPDVPKLNDGLDLNYHLPVFSSVCTRCKHLDRSVSRAVTGERARCVAFPEAIPDEIWLGKNPHTTPYSGDNGVQFEQITAEELAAA